MPFNNTAYNTTRYNGLGSIQVVLNAVLAPVGGLAGLTKLTRLARTLFAEGMRFRSTSEGGKPREVGTSGGKRFKL